MIPFTPIQPVRTIDAVAERLEARIFDGTFAPGDKLPSESQIAAQLHVGRRTVREALKVLETKGLVEIKMGVGAIVKCNNLDSFLQALTHNINSYLTIDKADIIHVMELRWLLERAALQRLMQNPDQERLRRLAENVQAQRRADLAGDADDYQDWHFRFHHDIVDALNNPVISMIYRQVLALVRKPMERAGQDLTIRRQSIADHEIMVNALCGLTPDELEAALQRHLEGFIANLTAEKQTADPVVVNKT